MRHALIIHRLLLQNHAKLLDYFLIYVNIFVKHLKIPFCPGNIYPQFPPFPLWHFSIKEGLA